MPKKNGNSSNANAQSETFLSINFGLVVMPFVCSAVQNDSAIKAAAIQNENLSIRLVELDVTDDSSVRNMIDHIISEAGRIDVLVVNAGYGLVGALEDFSMKEL
jgi:NAD(P)-dependent dehydrogenase (short-subunit alcohol dehydrogenase family)